MNGDRGSRRGVPIGEDRAALAARSGFGQRPARAGYAQLKAWLKTAAPELYADLSRAWHSRPGAGTDPRFEWKISIYGGDDVLTLRPLEDGRPALTKCDVTDVAAEYVADPFLVSFDGTWHIFFEVFNSERNKGEIALATSSDLRTWHYRAIVLREPHHLSYPYVFEYEGKWYMVPESWEAHAVWLYEADPFPWKWRRSRILLAGKVLLDPSLFRHGGRWWMFVETNPKRCCDTLRLFGADLLTGPWKEHPKSPIVAGDARIARPAGRVIECGGRPVRFAQECSGAYGTSVSAFALLDLTTTSYREHLIGRVLAPDLGGAYPNGMHHIDAVNLEGRWIAVVDGR
jgi:hypothetical protein